MMLDAYIQGIPCTVELEYHKPYRGEREKGKGEDEKLKERRHRGLKGLTPQDEGEIFPEDANV